MLGSSDACGCGAIDADCDLVEPIRKPLAVLALATVLTAKTVNRENRG